MSSYCWRVLESVSTPYASLIGASSSAASMGVSASCLACASQSSKLTEAQRQVGGQVISVTSVNVATPFSTGVSRQRQRGWSTVGRNGANSAAVEVLLHFTGLV